MTDLVVPEPRRRQDYTHFVHPDELVGRNGDTTAVCGYRVNEHRGEVDPQAPTCPWCQAWLHERNHDA